LCISCNQPVCGKHSTSVKKCVNCAWKTIFLWHCRWTS
jgi:hypothetical protein